MNLCHYMEDGTAAIAQIKDTMRRVARMAREHLEWSREQAQDFQPIPYPLHAFHRDVGALQALAGVLRMFEE